MKASFEFKPAEAKRRSEGSGENLTTAEGKEPCVGRPERLCDSCGTTRGGRLPYLAHEIGRADGRSPEASIDPFEWKPRSKELSKAPLDGRHEFSD